LICIFCFYNVSTGIQAQLAFSKVFRHCNIITFDGDNWLALEFDLQGFHSRRINVYSSSSLLRGLKFISSLQALIAVDIEEKAEICWKPFIVRSCNEIDRYISGVDVGFTFNPKHLYNKLIKNSGSNYQILYEWRR
jgi:hypothetical protein